MLIPVEILSRVWKIKPSGVLHVGAHEAEELEDYEEFQWGNVTWGEAQPNKAKALKERLVNSRHSVIHATLSVESFENFTQKRKRIISSRSPVF